MRTARRRATSSRAEKNDQPGSASCLQNSLPAGAGGRQGEPHLLLARRNAQQGGRHVLDLADRPVYRLAGGYRAYRQYVVSRLESYDLLARLIVLHGLTGVGKTDILKRLSREGVPVLDLEEMAGHRGSAFGTLGEIRPRNQKMFDSLLFHTLERFKDEPYLFMEAESKRIGRVLMPDFLEEAKTAGIPVIVEASFDVRVSRILETYLRGRRIRTASSNRLREPSPASTPPSSRRQKGAGSPDRGARLAAGGGDPAGSITTATSTPRKRWKGRPST